MAAWPPVTRGDGRQMLAAAFAKPNLEPKGFGLKAVPPTGFWKHGLIPDHSTARQFGVNPPTFAHFYGKDASSSVSEKLSFVPFIKKNKVFSFLFLATLISYERHQLDS